MYVLVPIFQYAIGSFWQPKKHARHTYPLSLHRRKHSSKNDDLVKIQHDKKLLSYNVWSVDKLWILRRGGQQTETCVSAMFLPWYPNLFVSLSISPVPVGKCWQYCSESFREYYLRTEYRLNISKGNVKRTTYQAKDTQHDNNGFQLPKGDQRSGCRLQGVMVERNVVRDIPTIMNCGNTFALNSQL